MWCCMDIGLRMSCVVLLLDMVSTYTYVVKGGGVGLTQSDSVVFLQRHLPVHTRRPPTAGSAAVVDQSFRAKRIGCARS